MPKRVRKGEKLTGVADDDHFEYFVGLETLVALVGLLEGLALDALDFREVVVVLFV